MRIWSEFVSVILSHTCQYYHVKHFQRHGYINRIVSGLLWCEAQVLCLSIWTQNATNIHLLDQQTVIIFHKTIVLLK